jgi:chemotaxis protein methyltransferase CheR
VTGGARTLPRPQDDQMLARFKELILRTCGFSLEKGREQTLITALRERMVVRGLRLEDAYHALLNRDREELNALVELLTVNETYFFREPGHLEMAADELLPEFLRVRTDRPIRIVSAGCSTGEEPYSIAMMLRERYGIDCERLFAIGGVDIDSGAIAAARRGVYGRGSFRGLDQGVLGRYFDSAGPGEYRIRDQVKTLVEFEVANLMGPDYPQVMQRPDLIFYRNVSIYFPKEVQQQIFARLAALLTPGGYLLVGSAETIHHDIGILSLVERGSLFFYRKAAAPVPEERRGYLRREPVSLRPATPSAAPPVVPSTRPRLERAPQARPQLVPRKPRESDPPDQREIELLYEAALAVARNGEHAKALQLLDTLIELAPAFAKGRTLKGSLLLNDARYQEAAAVCQEIIAGDPLSLEAYLMLGIIARHQGNNDEAFRRFREAAYLDASCWLAHFYSAEILFAQGEGKRARSSYETASRILEKGIPGEHGQAIFQLSFNAEQFIVICRHKLSLLKENG